jgi:glycosyltransferase involved in cell wall biosynthesis
MNKFTIGITTFSKRFSYVETLINQLRNYTDFDILISVNGDYNKTFDNEYRKKILLLCSNYDNVFPIFFPEQRGLSKLWNTLIVHSKTDWCLLLNDDVEIISSDLILFGQNNLNEIPDIRRINGSFSHFFVHKKLIDELGYFDERLLGFGEEDGDIFFRYIEKYNRWIQDSFIGGINNLVIDIRDEGITGGSGKYSAFNRDFCFLIENCKYIADPNGIKGCFGYEMRKNISDINLYPYENFFMENKNKL